MQIYVAQHPLITHKLTVLRDWETPPSVFRQLVEELTTLLAYEATRKVSTSQVEVQTPLTMATGSKLSSPLPIIIPILRAGLGMLDGIIKLMPTAEVGFLGIRRNEETLEPFTYANRLPDDLTDRQVFIIDPMLATGGTIIDSIKYVFERGARDVTCICLIGAPEGLAAIREQIPNSNVKIHLGVLDEKLTANGYIFPGLGDAGDRLYGSAN